MIVGKSRADRFTDFKATCRREEEQFGRSERVFLAELEDSMVVAALIGSIEAVDAEVEVEDAFPRDPGLLNRLSCELTFFFLQPEEHQFVIFSH